MTRDEASARTCQWRQDEHNGIWHSACGPMWPFEEGGPRENGCTYCPRCGGVIEVYAGSFAGWLAAVVEQNTPIAPRDDTAELVEAVDTFLSGLEDFLGATTAVLEDWENGNRPNIPAYGAAAARLATSGGKLRAALARVKGGER